MESMEAILEREGTDDPLDLADQSPPEQLVQTDDLQEDPEAP